MNCSTSTRSNSQPRPICTAGNPCCRIVRTVRALGKPNSSATCSAVMRRACVIGPFPILSGQQSCCVSRLGLGVGRAGRTTDINPIIFKSVISTPGIGTRIGVQSPWRPALCKSYSGLPAYAEILLCALGRGAFCCRIYRQLRLCWFGIFELGMLASNVPRPRQQYLPSSISVCLCCFVSHAGCLRYVNISTSPARFSVRSTFAGGGISGLRVRRTKLSDGAKLIGLLLI
jgi:hypothetical protein